MPVNMALDWIKNDNEINTTGTEINPTICSNGTHIFMTYITSGSLPDRTNAGNYDLVIMKLSLTGNIIWTKQDANFNTPNYENNPSICYDENTNSIYVSYVSVGYIPGQSNFGYNDIIVLRMNMDGDLIWIKQSSGFNTTGSDEDPAITCDNNGVYITYTTDSAITNLTKTGNTDIVVFKLNKTNGNLLWVKQNSGFNTTSVNTNSKICSDGTKIYIVYDTNGTISGGTKTGTIDLAIFALNTDGDILWTKQDSGINVNTENKNATICANLDNSGFFLSHRTTGSKGDYDIVVLSITNSGAITWRKQDGEFNTSLTNKNPSITCNTEGIYVSYESVGSINVFKLNTNGNLSWKGDVILFNVAGTNELSEICISGNNEVTVCYQTTNNAYGNSDVVIFKLKDLIHSSSACFSYNTLNKIIEKIKANNVEIKSILVFGGLRGDKKMYRCEIEGFGEAEFTHDHPFIYNGILIDFDNLKKTKIVTKIEEIEDIKDIKMMYNIVGCVEDQMAEKNKFLIGDNLYCVGGRIKKKLKNNDVFDI